MSGARLLAVSLPLLALGFGFGVDWGAEYHKSSMIIPGQHFQAVENEISKRKTHNLFSICGEERYFEAQAAAKLTRSSCQSFFLTNRLLYDQGTETLQQAMNAESEHVAPQKLLVDEHGLAFALDAPIFLDSLNFTRSALGGAQHYLRLEEVIAMIMEKNLINARNTGKVSFTAGVLTLWDNAAPIRVRRMLQSAMALGGLRLTGFVHENLAAAVYDSLSREGSEGPATNFFFVNIGSSGTRASIITYSSQQELWKDNSTHWAPAVSAAAHIFLPGFSGHGLDKCLAETVLAAAPRRPASLHPAKTRLLYAEAKRVKELLSANKETQVFIEDFFDSGPLSVAVSRAMFEKGCAALFAQLKQGLSALRKRAEELKLKVERAELMGGVVRVSKVQEIVREALKVPTATRINGDEGMSLGAALVSANLTAGMRVQKVVIEDRPAYGIGLELRKLDEEAPWKVKTLFEAGAARYGLRKLVSLDGVWDDFELLLKETPGDYRLCLRVEGNANLLRSYADHNITDSKLHLSFELDHLGLPRLLRAEALFKEHKQLNETLTTQTHRKELRFNRTSELPPTLGDSPELLAQSKELLRKMGAREAQKRVLAEKRNKLESLAYSLREIAEEGSPYLKQTELGALGELSARLSAHLESEEFWTADLPALEQRLREVDESLAPLNHRKAEHASREKLQPSLQTFFANTTTAAEQLIELQPWLSPEQVTAFRDRLERERQWVEEQFRLQSELPRNEDPLFTVAELRQKVKSLEREHTRLRLTPKPRPATAKAPDVMPDMSDLLKNLNMTQDQIDELMKAYRANVTVEDSTLNATSSNATQEQTAEPPQPHTNEATSSVGDEL